MAASAPPGDNRILEAICRGDGLVDEVLESMPRHREM